MAKKDRRIKEKALLGKDRVGFILDLFYAFIFCLSIAIFAKIIYIQVTYRVDPKVAHFFRPANTKRAEQPRRGAILSHDGRILAISTPLYQVYMDCTVQKDLFRQDKEHGEELEKEWRAAANDLSKGLARIYQDKTAKEYYDLILASRRDNKRYVRIGDRISHATLQEVKALPLFSKGPNVGGIIVEKFDSREYPYGSLARRTIGYVRNNDPKQNPVRVGIEGRFDYVLHGKDGYEWLRKADKGGKVHNFDSTAVKAVDGDDIRTTLDIDFQDIADRAIRRQITEEERLSGACAVIMEVGTGAIRAMVNLTRDTTLAGSPLTEKFNLAISQAGEPGSVFKTVTLTSLIEDGYVHSVDECVPTNRGIIPHAKTDDVHIRDWEDSTHRKTIPIKRGLEISSNYVFAHLAWEHYHTHPADFYDKLYRYKLAEQFDFDIDGLATPGVVTPANNPSWTDASLETAAYGYSVSVTPLHLLTFYNGIANKGRMMRPYLVEDVERNGRVLKKYGPGVLGNICSRATADTVTRALRGVVTHGTARSKLRAAELPVAGKTGTSRVVLSPEEKPIKGNAYQDASGRKKNQGTFIGFFPYNRPKYSVIVTVYSRLSHGSFYGGDAPAKAVREIVDNIFAIDPEWNPVISRKGTVAETALAAIPQTDGTAPDVKGLGLADALYAVESNGYRCRYEGCGKVKAQTPAAGTKLGKGETITLTLQ